MNPARLQVFHSCFYERKGHKRSENAWKVYINKANRLFGMGANISVSIRLELVSKEKAGLSCCFGLFIF